MTERRGPDHQREETLGRMVAVYQEPLLRMCRMCLRDDAAAEDAVQETFFKAFRALSRFRGQCSEKTWLMRIALNVCRDAGRSAWSRHTDRRVTPEELPLAAEERQDDSREELARAIRRLPSKQRDAVLLYYYQDMTLTEAAQALRVSPSVVSRRLKAARNELREALERGREHA